MPPVTHASAGTPQCGLAAARARLAAPVETGPPAQREVDTARQRSGVLECRSQAAFPVLGADQGGNTTVEHHGGSKSLQCPCTQLTSRSTAAWRAASSSSKRTREGSSLQRRPRRVKGRVSPSPSTAQCRPGSSRCRRAARQAKEGMRKLEGETLGKAQACCLTSRLGQRSGKPDRHQPAKSRHLRACSLPAVGASVEVDRMTGVHPVGRSSHPVHCTTVAKVSTATRLPRSRA